MRRRSRKSRLPGIVSGLAGLAFVAGVAGCADYRLGSSLPPGVQTVHVPSFVNKSGEPRADTEATRATLEEFQKDGTLRLTGADNADAILRVTLTDCKLEELSYEKDSRRTTREYRMRLLANIVLERRRTGEVLLRKKVEGETTIEPAGDLSSAKRVALPLASRDLAHDIVESVVEFW